MSLKDDVRKMHIGFPRDYIALSRGFTGATGGKHGGVDMCWNSSYGGAYALVFAPFDGEVVALKDGMDNTWSYDKSNWGNYIKIKHADGVYTLSAHLLKGSLRVKIGQKVKRGEAIAQMDNSGASQGCHVHFELYIGGSGTSYRVDPLLYCYAYVGEDTVATEKYFDGTPYKILRYEPIPKIGKPVARNKMVDQIEVHTDDLNARKDAGLKGERMGYVSPGIYNVVESADLDGYRWYKSDQDFWFANDPMETWCTYMPTEYVGHPVERNEYVNQIKVTATTLRARKAAILDDGNILGFVNPGIYNCIGRTANAGYLWFKAEDEWDDFWCAQKPDGDWVEFLPAKIPHYNLTMKKLNEAQKSAMEAWCKSENVEYTIEDA